MTVVGAGRASEILDLGDGRVLRRFKAGGRPEREALVMRHDAAHGFPVPRVDEVRPDALVLEQIRGPTMFEDLRRRPWKLRSHAALLARLHDGLHAISAPSELGDGRLLHMDFHPENVILSPSGPVVIDRANARAGDPRARRRDGLGDRVVERRPAARLFLRRFLRRFDLDETRRALPAAAELRIADRNVTDEERTRVRRLLAGQHGVAGSD